MAFSYAATGHWFGLLVAVPWQVAPGPGLAGPAPELRLLVYSWVVTALTSV
jgi:hypothetical protein